MSLRRLASRSSAALALALAGAAGGPARAGNEARVVVHAGWGTPEAFVLSGRVLEGSPPAPPSERRGRLRAAAETARALETDEVEGALVELEVDGRRWEVRTDGDGVWRVEGSALAVPLRAGAIPARVRLAGRPEVVEGILHVYDPGPAVAVISDVDDTVLDSGVTSKGRLLYRTFTRDASRMEPVPGAAEAFGRASRAGARAFFWVSGSPQNLQERLSAFLDRQGLPRGPLLLKNVGEDPLLDQRRYKTNRIEALLARFPHWRFVLVGDSGEQDPEIYRAIREAHPGRVAGIAIRRVPGAEGAAGRLEGMAVVDDWAGAPDVIAALLRGR